MMEYRSVRSAGLVPYVAGEQPDDPRVIKLNTNESPYPPSPRVVQAIRGAADGDLRLYPPTDGRKLRVAIAKHHGLAVENVFCGNGSDEVLALAYLAFFGQDRPLCSPELTYSFYPVYAKLFEVPYQPVPMREGLRVDVDALIAANRAIALANPNAPTTIALSLEEVRRVAREQRERGHLLMVDEAYADFAQEDCVPLVEEFENVLIVRTMSKSYALAGLRVGYALGQPHLIDALTAVKDSFNSYPMDRLAIAGGTAAVEDDAHLRSTVAAVVATRSAFTQELRGMGFWLPDSSANFVFARHERVPAKELFAALRERNILVRHFAKPPTDQYLRITIGTEEQMQAVCAALREIL